MVLTSSTVAPKVQKDTETIFVLFGSTGDLARRKIMPALCGLFGKKLLPENFSILAYSRRHWGDVEYREFIHPALATLPAEVVERFLHTIQHVEGTFDTVAGFALLKEKIAGADVLYYLAVQPELYPQIVEKLGTNGLHGKLLIEKPFGRDLASAGQLEQLAEKFFSSKKIFRIDHYLGTDGLVAVSTYRKENVEFEEKLNNEHVASITCRIFETLGVEGRGEFYDSLGALRDVGQSHLLQMLKTLVPIVSLAPAVHIVRGQYKGYTNEPNVQKDSQTETFFRITAESSDPHWVDVSIVLEAGKALSAKKSEIEVIFKDGTKKVFPMNISGGDRAHEAVIQAALRADLSFFVSLYDVFASWRFAQSALDLFHTVPLTLYKRGVDASGIV